MSYEKIEIILDLIRNITPDEWKLIKKVLDSNFSLINVMVNDLNEANLIRNKIKQELLSSKKLDDGTSN